MINFQNLTVGYKVFRDKLQAIKIIFLNTRLATILIVNFLTFARGVGLEKKDKRHKGSKNSFYFLFVSLVVNASCPLKGLVLIALGKL